jgi:peptidoglycan/LPS O-acetylase OafA/YrhL
VKDQRKLHATSGDFRPDLEGLRGVAILLVLLYHARLPGFDGGFVGVDVFFVLSGFLITGLLLREHERFGRIDLGAFYARRVRRILPAAAVVLVATMILSWFLLAPLELPRRLLSRSATSVSRPARRTTSGQTSRRPRSSTTGRSGWKSSSTSCGRLC